MRTRRVAGCMTGTSIDALDAAAVEVEGTGLSIRARVVGATTRPLGQLGDDLRLLASGVAMPARAIAALARDLALLHAEVILELGAPPDLACVHGQTVFHEPPLSWQLMQPAVLAHALGVPVVCDLRAADLAAGGRGAPITPVADFVLFRDARERRAIVNLGGFCNVTRLPAASSTHTGVAEAVAALDDPAFAAGVGGVEGLDVCACNQVLDAVARAALGRAFDEGGAIAALGRADGAAKEELATCLRGQRASGRSLGTGDEQAAWVERWASRLDGADLARTACEAIGGVIAEAAGGSDRVILAGGGVANATLSGAIRSAAGVPVDVSDDHGVPATHREAACFAVLGALCQDRVPITLPRVTGVPSPAPAAGAWVFP